MEPDVNLRRGANPHFLPPDFWDIICNRYFPVLSLTYISSVLGIALQQSPGGRDLIQHLFEDRYPYHMALWVALWVSIPAVFWIILRGSIRYAHRAGIWYKGIAGTMILLVLLSYALFPEWSFGRGGFRIFLVVTLPVFLIQYYFFIRGGLPSRAAWPLTLGGLVFMIYGIVVV